MRNYEIYNFFKEISKDYKSKVLSYRCGDIDFSVILDSYIAIGKHIDELLADIDNSKGSGDSDE